MSEHTFRTGEDYRDHLPCTTCEPEAAKAALKVKKSAQLLQVLDLIQDEVNRAAAKYPPMNSAHEAWAVLFEEVDELWEEVRAKQGERNVEAMKAECIQVAAMAVRFALDICMSDRGQK